MFPLIGILVAAALLFTKRKKAPAVVAVVPAKSATTATKAPVKSTAKPAPAPSKAPAKTPAKTSATGLPTSSIQGLPLPSASQYTADLLGSMLGNNPKVLSPSLPYGYYNPATNNTGSQTPPIVVPAYR